VRREMAKYRLQECGEFSLRHLSGCHSKFAVLNDPQAANMAGDRHVVGRIGEYRLSALFAKQGLLRCGRCRISVGQTMAADLPDVARAVIGGRD
jgi:hypothetical protein